MIIAIDPGKDKCGAAVLTAAGEVVEQKIIETGKLAEEIAAFAAAHDITSVVVGNGTTSKSAQKKIAAALPETKIFVVDEYKTTEQARKDYFAAHPPTGWRKFLPLGLQTPPVPVDDFAAVRLGKNFLAGNRQADLII